MKLLAVDTALGACSCAVVDDARILAHRFEIMDRGHAERLAPMVAEAMRDSGIAFSDLQRLAVTTGPGTFTGQRVGLAFARGLRIALRRPLTGVTTLQAMATAAIAETGAAYGAALHDAKRNEVYFELLQEDRTLIPAAIAPLEDALAMISKAAQNAKLAFAGTAAEPAAMRYGGEALLTQIRQPDALWVARIALARPASAEAPGPLYLRPPDAKLPAQK
ncbi:MAG TPA: tRNA (adenosine(37)-N6)-threonylcarbamoyltransferase complex dimerization subunit type 1 TsaB [Rhizomicrobium sp.]|nr:tRNA (adenosine(37)-N6)-threonylcarbamoyltransferase complex dimerization subunit type 1 TsaB [Rhizomicrobium sp.]